MAKESMKETAQRLLIKQMRRLDIDAKAPGIDIEAKNNIIGAMCTLSMEIRNWETSASMASMYFNTLGVNNCCVGSEDVE